MEEGRDKARRERARPARVCHASLEAKANRDVFVAILDASGARALAAAIRRQEGLVRGIQSPKAPALGDFALMMLLNMLHKHAARLTRVASRLSLRTSSLTLQAFRRARVLMTALGLALFLLGWEALVRWLRNKE